MNSTSRKRLLVSALLAASVCVLALRAAAPLVKDNGLAKGAPADVLPQNAIAHVQISSFQRILENTEKFILNTIPDKLLPPDAQQLFSMEHPVLTVLGQKIIEAPLTGQEISDRTGLASGEAITLTLYPGVPTKSFIVTIPITDHGRFETFLRHALNPESLTVSSVGGKEFIKLRLNGGKVPELLIATSADRAYISGEQSLLMLLYSGANFPKLSANPHFAKVLEATSPYDIWFTIDPNLVRPLLPQLQFFKYVPLQLAIQKRDEFLAKIPAQQRHIIEERLRAQFAVQSLEELGQYLECFVAATYEEIFDWAVSGLKDFNGLTLAYKADASFPQATVFVHSEQFQADRGTAPIPMDAARIALSQIQGEYEHVEISGRKPEQKPSPRVAAWLNRIKTGLEAKQLKSGFVKNFEEVFLKSLRPQPIEARVPWTVRTRESVNQWPDIAGYSKLPQYGQDLAVAMAYPPARPVTIVPSNDAGLLESVLKDEMTALQENEKLVREKLTQQPADAAFLRKAYRLNHRDLDHSTSEITWETSLSTRSGFFGFNQHELISRRVYFSRPVGDYLVFHQASKDPAWISRLTAGVNRPIAPAVSALLQRVPEGARHVALHRPLADLPDVLDWISGLEQLLLKDADAFLAEAKKVAENNPDAEQLVKQLQLIKFSPVVYSINRDPGTGELYALLPGGLSLPRAPITPEVLQVFADFRARANELGGFLCYTRSLNGTFEASSLFSTEGLSYLVKSVGNSVQERYLADPAKLQELQKRIILARDTDPERGKQILARNPTWMFLPAPGENRQGTAWIPEAQKKPALPQHPLPPRDAQTPAACLDLGGAFNASVQDSWHAGGTQNNDLGALPQGVRELASTQFDVRGIVQLSSKAIEQQLNVRFPKEVKGIKVDRTCQKLSFLHGTGWNDAPGTKIGAYVVHYADGQTEEIPLIYGSHLIDWWTQPNISSPPESELAWSGTNPAATQAGITLQLYKTTWKNPRPDAPIQSIDFVTTMANSAPFLLAITAE